MSTLPNCLRCKSANTYQDRGLYACPECVHEWSQTEIARSSEARAQVNDVNGNLLGDGYTVTAIKDLKVKGSSLMVKVGTRVKNIRLFGGDHDIDCKVNGIGAMKLRSQFGKKAPR